MLGFEQSGCKIECFAELSFRLSNSAKAQKRHALCAKGFGEFGTHAQDSLAFSICVPGTPRDQKQTGIFEPRLRTYVSLQIERYFVRPESKAQQALNASERRTSGGELRRNVQHVLKVRDCLLEPSERAVDQAEYISGCGEFGLQLQRPAKAGLRSTPVAQGAQRSAKVAMCFGESGGKQRGEPKSLNRGAMVVERGQGQAERIVMDWVRALEVERAIDECECRAVLSGLVGNQAE
jgi:hypothetical protein